MTLLEFIFNGYLLQCSCGKEYHAPAKDIIKVECECGETLEAPKAVLDKNWNYIQNKANAPEDFLVSA